MINNWKPNAKRQNNYNFICDLKISVLFCYSEGNVATDIKKQLSV
jgi:hypothetical protein